MSKRISQQDIEVLYDLYFEKVYRFFYYKFLSREMAEDLTSETFLTFVKQSKKNTDIDDPKKYLFGIARNIFLKTLEEKYKKGIQISFDAIADRFADYVEEIDESRAKQTPEDVIKPLIKQLPEKQRRILHMRLIEKHTLSDICEKLGKDMNYVKTTQKRGIKKLKELIARTL